jgi:phytoene dehydrogenase-like protein
MGVEYLNDAEVDSISTAAGRATGVVLADGTHIASDVVISGLGLPQTVLRLLRDVQVDGELARRLRNINYDRGQLLWANIALGEAPAYRADIDNPGVGEQPRLYWGPKDLDYLTLRYQPEIFMNGFASQPYVLCSVDSLWDGTRAPAGSHIVGVEEFAAPRRLFSDERWKEIKGRFMANLLHEWSHYAPNMACANVIASRVYTPADIERERPDMAEGGYSAGATIASQLGRFRPVAGISGYKLLLDNLYNCSSNLHSGPGIGRGSSWNCFQEIARDLALEPSGVAA